MSTRDKPPRALRPGQRRPDARRLDDLVARAVQGREQRMRGYRERSLKLHPWVCARCGREYDRSNLHELTVHHRDHDHDHNPPDGSNWENLCLYCHDNEHQKFAHLVQGGDAQFGLLNLPGPARPATHNALGGLRDLLKNRGKK